ncbi:MAG: hypothetical protein Q8R53_06045 [Nanoarchaeota archaeon]|nr:hypothetical protein [Nanoarchaeota archaeon]
MKNYICSLVALGTFAVGSPAYAQEAAPAVSEEPQMTWESPVCGRAAGTITEKVYQEGNTTTLEFSRDGDVYGYTVRTRGENGVLTQYSLADFDNDGQYERIDAEDVICPRQ